MLTCFFFIPVAPCTTNTHQKTRQLTRSTTCRFYVAFEKLYEESSPTCGQQRIFSSTMTMPPAYSAHVIHAFLAQNSMTFVRHAPYSPDLAPCDFWLFPKLKTILKGRRFQSREDTMKKSTEELGSIPEEFKRCFEKWQKRWEKCVYRQAEYFEGD